MTSHSFPDQFPMTQSPRKDTQRDAIRSRSTSAARHPTKRSTTLWSCQKPLSGPSCYASLNRNKRPGHIQAAGQAFASRRSKE